MNFELLKNAVHLAEESGHVFIATSDKTGLPHVAAAGDISLTHEGFLLVKEWFCPGTVENIHVNPHIAIVIWDVKQDQGFQLLGRMKDMIDVRMLNGYAPEIKKLQPVPQVQWQLLISIDKIIDFKHAPHSDTEGHVLSR